MTTAGVSSPRESTSPRCSATESASYRCSAKESASSRCSAMSLVRLPCVLNGIRHSSNSLDQVPQFDVDAADLTLKRGDVAVVTAACIE